MLENMPFFPLAQAVAPRPPATSNGTPTTAPAPSTLPATMPNTAPATLPITVPPVGTPELADGKPSLPLEFKQTESAPTGLTITWKDADKNIDFHVLRSDDGGKTFAQIGVAPTKKDSDFSLTDAVPEANKAYGYKIVAYNTATKQESDPLTGTAVSAPAPFLGGFGNILMAVVLFGGLYFFLFRGQRKDKKKRESMIKELKKGDKIMTIGGMVARVISIDGDDVVLKIDESNNTKATYRKSAIQEVLDRDEKKS